VDFFVGFLFIFLFRLFEFQINVEDAQPLQDVKGNQRAMTPATKAMTATAKEEARTDEAPATTAGGVYDGIGAAASLD
jgi:hypothetical protein